jgi:broad specificity phosphatase PhoE
MDMSMPDCTIVLVRHAHNGMAGRFCGESDPPLSEQGMEQAAKLAKELAAYFATYFVTHSVTHIFSSDLRRAQQTANAIAGNSALPVELLPSLREIRFGEWEGLNWDEVRARDADFAARWMDAHPLLAAPGGEDFVAFRERVCGAMAEVAKRTAGGCSAVVTHGGVIRTFLLDVLGLPPAALASLPCEYASWVELQMRAGRWRKVSPGGPRQMPTNL